MPDFEEIKYPGGGGLDQDSSWELVKIHDYVHALNIIKTEHGDRGVITNVKGTEEISFSLPAGYNKVVGFCEDKEAKAGIFFILNSNWHDCIARYKPDSNSVDYILYDQSILNLQSHRAHRINNARVVGSGKDRILFWTDNYNPPRKLNLYRARAYTNTSTTTTTTTTSTTTV